MTKEMWWRELVTRLKEQLASFEKQYAIELYVLSRVNSVMQPI
jgi:hypothetical protein